MSRVEKIREKAAILRAKKATASEPAAAPVSERKAPAQNTSESSVRVWWETRPFFWRYYSYRFGARSSYSVSLISGTIAFLALLPFGVALAAFLDNEDFRAWILSKSVFIGSGALVLLCSSALWALVSYARFLRWKERAGFPIEGFNQLTEGVTFKKTSWRFCRMNLEAAPAGEASQTIADSLELFSDRANRWFYDFEEDDAKRQAWKSSDFSASGSVNARITGELMRFLSRDLSAVHAQYRCILRVRLEIDRREFTVEPVAYGD